MIVFLAWMGLVLAAVPFLLCLSNLLVYRRPEFTAPEDHFAVSVLIPARNEELSIAAAVHSVLASQHLDLEVIVLDDHSEDGTARIVQEIAARDSRVQLATAPALPLGWCGKQFACFTLASLASKPVLCFLDADVRVAPDGLARMVRFLRRSEAPLVSGVPRQETKTWSEQLLLPLIHFILLGYLPMWAMRKSKDPVFAAGCGQLFVAERETYMRVGGHSKIQGSRHDGITLPRAYRDAGCQTDLCDATPLATCRMYRNASQVFQGLLKNATEGIASPKRIWVFSLLLFGGEVLPVILLGYSLLTGVPRALVYLLVAATGLAYGLRLLLALRFAQPALVVLVHPLSILSFLALQWYALFRQFAGLPSTWKDRTYQAT
ncbi:MAG TPA: glycosyltransferase family 2 protein [Bryobacteraceae bacterium]|nr:glycosyltransferase family 2 protein [Bryobacteraceae bacterium]